MRAPIVVLFTTIPLNISTLDIIVDE